LFSYFFIFPSGAPRSIPGVRAKKKISNPLDAPDDPSPSYISHESRGRRVRSPGDGSRRGHPGCPPGGPELSRSATPGPQIGRLRSDFGPGVPAPCRPKRRHSGPLSSPAARRHFQNFRFVDFWSAPMSSRRSFWAWRSVLSSGAQFFNAQRSGPVREFRSKFGFHNSLNVFGVSVRCGRFSESISANIPKVSSR
jgi:hypothetical protein